MDEHVDSEDAAVEDDADASDADAGVDGADAPDADPGADGDGADASTADGEADADVDPGAEDEAADLRARAEALESERDDLEERVEELESKLKRSRADFQNYKKRAKKKQDQIRERATEDLVEQLVKVRDNLVRALDQDEDADIRDGVESTLREFDRVLEDENVSTIDPDEGDEVDPHRHEVMMRVESDVPEGTVADVYQPGYVMADKVVRPAQVTVGAGESESESGAQDGNAEADVNADDR